MTSHPISIDAGTIPPGMQTFPAAEAVALARDANDQLAAAIAAHPDRFAEKLLKLSPS